MVATLVLTPDFLQDELMMRLFRVLCVFIIVFFGLNVSTAVADEGADHLEDARALYQAGHWDDANQAFEKTYEIAGEGSEIRAAAALEWASLLWEQGSYGDAERLVQEAIELARELGLDNATGQLLVTLGHIEASKGELSAAENTLNICVQLTGELGDDVHRSLCRLNRRMVRTLRGTDPGDEAEFRADIAALQNTDSPLSVGTSLAKTAQLYRDNEDFARAQELLDEAQRAYQSAGSVPAMTRNRLRMVQLLHRQGDFEAAQPRLRGLLTQFETMKNRPMIIQTLALKAEFALYSGENSRALTFYRRALAISDSINNPQLSGRLHLALCEMNFTDSPGHCEEATKRFNNAEMRLLDIRAQTGLARSHQSRGQLEEARQAYREAIKKLEDVVDVEGPHALTHTIQLANLCQVEVNLGVTGALGTCQKGLEAFSKIGDDLKASQSLLHAATQYAAGRAAVSDREGGPALEHLGKAAEIYLSLDEPQPLMAADILLRRGAVQASIEGERENAPATFRRALSLTSDLDRSEENVAKTRIALQTQLAQHRLADERWEASIEILEKLTEEAGEAGDNKSAAWAYSGLARSYMQEDRRDEALAALRSGLPLAERAGDEELVENLRGNLDKLE